MSAKLWDQEEILYRQIHPSFLEGGEPSSQPFRPTPKDENKLSTDRASIVSAQQSYDLFTNGNGFSSAGVYGLTVGEFSAEKIDCIPDPIEPTNTRKANPAHCFADYSPL
jgi:hypothetical protein